MNLLPLWTARVRPIIWGTTVERRDQVLITRLSLVAWAVSAFFRRWPSMNGPFLRERAMSAYLLVDALDDELGGAAVVAGLVAARRLAPRRHRMAAAGGLALATAMRVVDGV